MLQLRHQFSVPSIGAAFSQHELRSEDLVICSSLFAGGRFDQVRGLPAGQRRQWSKAVVLLEGHVYARGMVLRPGDVVISRDWDDYPMRALDARTRYLLVSWRHGEAGDRARSSGISRDLRTFGAAQALATELDAGHRASSLAALIGALSSLGVGIAPEAPWVGPSIDPRHHGVAHALEGALFPLRGQPMVVDLSGALGLGERQTQRLLADYFQRYYVTAPSWRQFVYGMRLEVGVFLASSPGATSDIVARALGFASAAALCHAFHRAGLPSPQAVRRALGPQR